MRLLVPRLSRKQVRAERDFDPKGEEPSPAAAEPGERRTAERTGRTQPSHGPSQSHGTASFALSVSLRCNPSRVQSPDRIDHRDTENAEKRGGMALRRSRRLGCPSICQPLPPFVPFVDFVVNPALPPYFHFLAVCLSVWRLVCV